MIKICKRCKRKRLHYAKGLCASCYMFLIKDVKKSRGYVRKWAKKNIKEFMRKWYKKNRKKFNEYQKIKQREYREKKKEKLKNGKLSL